MFCSTCLSVDRQLYSICSYRDIFNMLSGDVMLKSTPVLCWECVAVLRKIKQFQDKVAKANELLTYQYQNEEKLFQNTLSNLQVSNATNELYIQDDEEKVEETKQNLRIKEELNTKDDSKKAEDEIKHEYNSDNESILSFDQSCSKDNASDLEIKKDKEHKEDIVRKKNRKLYEIVCEKPLKTDIENLTIKVPIGLDEMKLWMQKARDCDGFKQLKYRCEQCVVGWRKEEYLLDHIKRFHDPKAPYECEVCSKRFMERKHLSVHSSSHRFLRECGACRYRGVTGAIRRHLTTHGRRVRCRHCGGTWPNIRLLYKHYHELHENFICDYCKKVCKSKGVLAKHIAMNHMQFKCDVCNISYKRRASYLQHRNMKHSVSSGDEAYCVPCDKKFFNIYAYRSHLKYSSAHAHERKVDKSRQKAVCPDCGRVYSRKTYMMNHYRLVHIKTTNYHCVQCDKYFLNSTKYMDHVKYSHEGATKAKDKLCNICGRGFAEKRTLVNHIRTHLGERPFECEYCGAKFTQKYAMLSHVSHIHLKQKRKCWQGIR